MVQKPWVRQGEPSDIREIDRQDAAMKKWAKSTGSHVTLTEIANLYKLADRKRSVFGY